MIILIILRILLFTLWVSSTIPGLFLSVWSAAIIRVPLIGMIGMDDV